MITTRRGARAFLVVVLVLLNAYLLAIVWTFTVGHRVEATVDRCRVSRLVTCYGVWQVDGAADRGKLAGVGSVDVGDVVAVRVGPLGAYATDTFTPAFRILTPLAFDLLVGGLFLVGFGPLGGNRAAKRRRLLTVGPGGYAVEVRRGRAVRRDGSLAARLVGDTALDAEDQPLFTIAVSRLRIEVNGPDGLLRGYATRESAETTWTFHDAADREIAQSTFDVGALFTGRPFPILDPDGHPVGALSAAGLSGMVVRLEPGAPEGLRRLALALALASPRMGEATGDPAP